MPPFFGSEDGPAFGLDEAAQVEKDRTGRSPLLIAVTRRRATGDWPRLNNGGLQLVSLSWPFAHHRIARVPGKTCIIRLHILPHGQAAAAQKN